MRTKQEVKKELQEIEEKEKIEEENTRKQKNYENFKERSEDWMIGKAHADLEFINIRYSSDKEQSLLPISVSISGNCGHSFTGKAPITSATKTYFRNVWDTNYTQNERAFQDKLNKMVQNEVNKICRQLPVVLEMMGLQSNHYWINEEHFPKDKLAEIKNEVEKEQSKILNNYPDDEFLKLIRKQNRWMTKEGDPVPEHLNVDLSHSRMILFRYIFKNRPTLQTAFKETKFYKQWKQRIEADVD